MFKRLLLSDNDRIIFCECLKEAGIHPGIFYNASADSYPAMAVYVEIDIDSMSYGWEARGDYVYPSDFAS